PMAQINTFCEKDWRSLYRASSRIVRKRYLLFRSAPGYEKTCATGQRARLIARRYGGKATSMWTRSRKNGRSTFQENAIGNPRFGTSSFCNGGLKQGPTRNLFALLRREASSR